MFTKKLQKIIISVHMKIQTIRRVFGILCICNIHVVNNTKKPFMKSFYRIARGFAMAQPKKWTILELRSKKNIHHHKLFRNLHILGKSPINPFRFWLPFYINLLAMYLNMLSIFSPNNLCFLYFHCQVSFLFAWYSSQVTANCLHWHSFSLL